MESEGHPPGLAGKQNPGRSGPGKKLAQIHRPGPGIPAKTRPDPGRQTGPNRNPAGPEKSLCRPQKHSPDTPGQVLYRLGPLDFPTPETTRAAPTNQITGRKSRERRIAKTWNNYGAEIARQAALEDIPTEAALAVFCVEAGGQSHDPETNLVIIRYEPHIFKRKTGQESPAARGNQTHEWQNLTQAAQIDLQAAIWSTSWGLPQLMGFNYQVTRHQTPEAMAQAFQRSSTEQIKGFFDFIRENNLTQYIREKSWRSFTRQYNGPGQIDVYSSILTNYIKDMQTLKQRGATFAP